MTRRIVPSAAAMAVLVLLASGCSDDVMCPELGQGDTLPYVSAWVAQRSDDRFESTHAEIACTADPLPSLFITFINGREIQLANQHGDLGVLALLDEDLVLWQPGVLCSLEVTTDYGYATAGVATPDAPEAIVPAQISLGDTLTLVWTTAPGADYYEVSAVLVPDAAAASSIAAAERDTLALLVVTRDTVAVFLPEAISALGVVTGFVEAVAGPFPESGAQGNVSGDGWGFFTVRYADQGSYFEVVVSDAR